MTPELILLSLLVADLALLGWLVWFLSRKPKRGGFVADRWKR